MVKLGSILLYSLIAAGYFLFANAEVSVGGSAQRLFSLQTVGKPASDADRISVASLKQAEIVFNVKGADLLGYDRLVIPLFDGREIEAYLTQPERRSLDDLTWRGKTKYYRVEGDVIITYRKGYFAALIYTQHGVYEITPWGDKHILAEIDQSRYPNCGGEIDGGGAEPQRSTRSAAGVDSGDRIDVVVVYTTATKNILGGDPQAQAHAQAAVDAANTSYINSKIRQRIRMVHTQEFVYTESGNASTDLSNLRNNASIAALRETHKADLVSEISEVTGVCGIGYLMGSVAGNSNNAFTVTARSCAVGNLSFAHELGHNMGSAHNPENGSGATFPYGYGHYINGSCRTVMSYADPCSSGCPRVAYFSNPNVYYGYAVMGIENARDNARSINNTADTIAAYRYSGSSITLGSFNGGEWLPRLIARPVTWSTDNIAGNVRIDVSRDESTNWETVIASTPNDGSEPLSVVGRATRRGRVRVVSLNSPTVSDSSVTNITVR